LLRVTIHRQTPPDRFMGLDKGLRGERQTLIWTAGVNEWEPALPFPGLGCMNRRQGMARATGASGPGRGTGLTGTGSLPSCEPASAVSGAGDPLFALIAACGITGRRGGWPANNPVSQTPQGVPLGGGWGRFFPGPSLPRRRPPFPAARLVLRGSHGRRREHA